MENAAPRVTACAEPAAGIVTQQDTSTPFPTAADDDGDDAERSRRVAAFRKVRDLFVVKQFAGRDNLATPVRPGLYIGSVGAASNRDGLHATGITHILCVASSLRLQCVRSRALLVLPRTPMRSPDGFPDQFVYERLPLADVPTAPLHEHIPTGINFIDRAIGDGGRVLVHCFAGRSRSASLVIAYLMSRHGMTLDAAMELLKSVRPQVKINSGFLTHLRTLEADLARQAGETST